jgi:hypothetical protein
VAVVLLCVIKRWMNLRGRRADSYYLVTFKAGLQSPSIVAERLPKAYRHQLLTG